MPPTSPVSLPDDERNLHILIVRLSAIGDVLMASPVAQVLKEHYPVATVSWVVEPKSEAIVRANPYVDEVIVFERKLVWKQLFRTGRFISLYREVRDFSRELRRRNFSIALDLQGLMKSGLVAWLSGAPRRIGSHPAAEGNRLFMTDLVPRPLNATHITEAPLSTLAALGLPTTPRPPVLVAPEEDRLVAEQFLAEHGLLGQRFAVFCLTPSRPQKEWLWQRWGELADQLWERERLRTVFIGGPERRVDTLRLVENCKSRPVSAVGHTTLLQSAVLVQQSAVCVGTDTGLTYAALATNTPTVAIYGSTDPTWLAEEPNVAVCFHPMPCSPCGRRPSCTDFACLRAISPTEVADAACALLAQQCVTV